MKMLEEGSSSKAPQKDDDCVPEKMETDNIQDCNLIAKDEEVVIPKHPYEREHSNFEPNSWQWEKQDPQKYVPLEESKLTIVDSKVLLDEMMPKLKEVKEIVIDLEHHSYRSFQGLVCLVQISTRSEDFIVDSLLLKEELHVLNDVCTDANILKVLHGSERDINWLQRDFGVYMVNMFDTQQAARILQEEGISLAHILKRYCSVIVNKRYQLADWRTRPLPEEMMKYAREDTHYLLYIYDLYRNLLLERGDETKNLLKDVYTKSTSLCGMVYIKQVFHQDSYLAAYKKIKGKLNVQQLECFRLLYAWRDATARKEDESTGYTLPNKMMFQIAKALPSEPQGIITCCTPLPPLVNQHVEEVHKLVLKAIENVPEVPEEELAEAAKEVTENAAKKAKELERQLAIKNSKKTKKRAGRKQLCFECGKPGHWAKDCVKRRGLAATKIPMRGGWPSRGRSRSVPYGGYTSGVRNRGGARGYHAEPYGMNYHNTSPHYIHPYDNAIPRPRHLFGGNMYQGMDHYNVGVNPYNRGMNPFNVRPNPYNQGVHPYNPGMNHYYPEENPFNQGMGRYS